MNLVFKILHQLSLVKISSHRIKNWLANKNFTLLVYALQNAKFNERLLVIEAMRELRDQRAIKYLLKVAKKDYEKIAAKALDSSSILDTNKEYMQDIEDIRKERLAKLQIKKHRIKRGYKKERTNKHAKLKTLEKVKQQLKRPMLGGKWF